MVVCIIGWYGTETLGDRAILDGILFVINKISPNATIKLGSLFPFYTNRTLVEEKDSFNYSAPNIRIEVFDIKNMASRKRNIKQSDLILVGGGPLMDLEELFLIDNSFEIAKKSGIPTLLFGCGLGPLTKSDYIDCVKRIINNSTGISFRDNISANIAKKMFGDGYSIECLGDPAVISIENFKKNPHYVGDDIDDCYCAVNLREYPQDEYGCAETISEKCISEFVKKCSEFCEKTLLVPMHTFPIGGDDRLYLSQIKYKYLGDDAKVLHNPLNLHQMYSVYSKADICLGMRYHSIVMQTILNGNNYIINYTDSQTGKTIGFLKSLENAEVYYKDRTINIRDSESDFDIFLSKMDVSKERYTYNLSDMTRKYMEFIEKYI